MRYREWMRSEIEKKEEAEFSEFGGEEEYRRKMREAAEQRAGNEVMRFILNCDSKKAYKKCHNLKDLLCTLCPYKKKWKGGTV